MEPKETCFECDRAARWLPWVVAGSLLAAVLLLAMSLDPQSVLPGSRILRGLIVAAAGWLALRVLRSGRELRLRVSVAPESLSWSHGAQRSELRLEAIESLRYEAPFGPSRHWLPATVLVDRSGQVWRLSGLLGAGERLIDEIVRYGGRGDLEAWVEAFEIRRRMAHAKRRTAWGYLIAALILALGLAFHLR